MRREYLVCIEGEDDSFWKIMTASELFHRMDISDCTNESVLFIFLLLKYGLEKCRFYGSWCSKSEPFEPLRMEIWNSDGELLDAGYGTDH